MRIRRFSEARGIFHEDEISFEPSIYCFGGPGDDGGPSSSSSTAAMEDIGTADVDKGPGPGDPNTGGSGDGPTRDEIAARAGVNPDTIVGSGLGGRNPVMSGSGSPVKSGSAVAAEAAAKGVSVDEINSRINEASKAASNAAGIGAPSSGPAPADLPGLGAAGVAGSNIDSLIEQSTAFGYGPNIQSTDLPSQAEVSAAIAAGIPGVQAQTTGFTAPSVTEGLIGRAPGDMGRDTSIERDVFGSGEYDYTTQDIFDVDPTGLGFETPQDRIQRESQDNTRAAAQAAAAMEATEEAQRQAQMAALGVSLQDRALQTELDAINQARQTQLAEEDAEKAARESRTSAPESRSIDSLMGGTVFGVPDDLDPSEDIGMGQSAAARGINTNISGVPEVDATQQAADAVRAATGIQSVSGRGLPSDSAVAAAEERTVNGVPVTDFSQSRTERPSTFNPTVEVVNVSGPGRKEIDIADFQPTNYTAEDLARAEREFDQVNLDVAQRDFDAARREAYGDKQFGFDTGLPESIDVFGVNVPTTVGVVEGIADALFDPTSFAANAIAERGIKSVDGMSAEGTANYNPNGLEVVTAGGPLSEGGRTAAYDPSNNVVYDTSPFSGLNPFGEGVPDNIQDLYSRKNAIDDAERARQGGDGGEPIIPPLIDEDFIGEYQTPEREQFELGEYQYEPMDPVQISYTGIPTLAPRILRPSRVGSRNIQPLYDFSGLGSLRRS